MLPSQSNSMHAKFPGVSFSIRGLRVFPTRISAGGGIQRSPSLPLRVFTSFLILLLFLTSSPPLFAITMGQIRSGVAGAAGSGGQGSFSNLQNAGAASAALTAAMAQGNLKRAKDIIAAMNKAQSDAKRAATGKLPDGTAIPNGLKPGGLEPYVGKNGDGSLKSGFDANGNPITTSWSGAAIVPVEPAKNPAAAKDPNFVNITQSQQNAYLYWNTFHVGPQTTVNFDQSKGGETAGNWIAFNKVMSPSDPSHIFGKISAQGQVYILNQNGILFHNGSAVNVHSLVASTLPINANLAGDAMDQISARGIANNPDAQFLFSSLAVPAGRNDPNGFDPSKSSLGRNLTPGDVVVEKGASILSPVNEAGVGGLVALIGPNVRNEGSVATPNGQTILAAGLQVALIPHPSKDPSLRGMDVTVGLVRDPASQVNPLNGSAGAVLNNGILSAPKGNITLAGKSVSTGVGSVLESSTSVALNGRIDLIASSGALKNPDYGLFGPAYFQGSTGLLDLNAGSLIRILPERSDATAVPGSSLALNSLIDLVGRSIHFGDGAILLSPGAVATPGARSQTGDTLSSGVNLQTGEWFTPGSSSSQLVASEGQIYMESSSLIDVSGSSGVLLDSSLNYLKIQLRGPELANSPLQRNSAVRGKDLIVDGRVAGTSDGRILHFPTVADAYAAYLAGEVAWIGTPLGNASGYAGLITRDVSQLTQAGGSVSISAGDAFVMNEGSLINLSGGWTSYSGGNFATTKLLSEDGRTVDISRATPDLVYTSIVKETIPAYEFPYINGAAGGSLSINAPAVSLGGSISGLTTVGMRQLRSSPSSSMLPSPSSLTLSLKGESIRSSFADQSAGRGPATKVTISPYAPSVVFAGGANAPAPSYRIDPLTGLPSPVGAGLSRTVYLSPERIAASGIGDLTIENQDGIVSLPKGSVLRLPTLGQLDVNASRVNIDGSVIIPSGSVKLTGQEVPYALSSGGILIPEGTVLPSLIRVWTLAKAMDGMAAGTLLYQSGERKQDGTIDVLNPFQLNPSTDGTWNIPVTSLAPYTGGTVDVSSSATILTKGALIDDTPDHPAPFSLPAILSGGSIQITAMDVTLASGALLDVSGGALQTPSSSVTYGDAGSLSILSGRDPENAQMHGGSLVWGADFLGYGGAGKAAGSLTLGASAFQFGGNNAPSGVTLISPGFLSRGGFSSFTFRGAGIAGTDGTVIPGIRVAPGAVLDPTVVSQRLFSKGQELTLDPYQQPENLAPAVSITMDATGVKDDTLPSGQNLLVRGDLQIGLNSRIHADPHLNINGLFPSASGGSLSLSGMTVSVQGVLDSPGGSIRLASSSGFFPINYSSTSDPSVNTPRVTLDLGPTAKILSSGTTLMAEDPSNRIKRYGAVLPGGNITVSGNLMAEKGAILDASGASGYLDVPAALLLNPVDRFSSTRVDSSGGTISLKGGALLYSDASLRASAGGKGALGGLLKLSSGRFYDVNADPTLFQQYGWDATLAIGGDSPAVPSGFHASGETAIGEVVPPSFGIALGGGNVPVTSFQNGGFDSLTLQGNVLFSTGGKELSLTLPGALRVADNGVLSADGSVKLSAGYLALGTGFLPPLKPGQPQPVVLPSPTTGSGVITATADLIDVGYLSLQGVKQATLDSGSGVIRGDGSFDIAGDITLRASLIHPVTGVSFGINAYPSETSKGSITIQSGGPLKSLPISAAGSLGFYASSILQGGNLAAPFGSITLGWDGTGTAPVDPATGKAVPAADQNDTEKDGVYLLNGSLTTVGSIDPATGRPINIPYGSSSDGTDWVDPSGTPITSSGIPSRSITLSALKLSSAPGSRIDLNGGGSLVAPRWISGLGGTIDYLAPGSGSYAILPGIQMPAAPTGYGDGEIRTGSRVSLSGIPGLPAGSYTLLPAIYATLPGAFLLTPSQKQISSATLRNPDGSWLVGGAFTGVIGSEIQPVLKQVFELDSPSVRASKVEYGISFADKFFSSVPSSSRNADAGHLILRGDRMMTLGGSVSGNPGFGGRGATIDLAGTVPIRIGASAANSGTLTGEILLDASTLSSWKAGSLLVGGIRLPPTLDGMTQISVTAPTVSLGEGVSLGAADLILTGYQGVSIGAGSSLSATGEGEVPNEKLVVDGNGALVRLSADSAVSLTRNVSGSPTSLGGTDDSSVSVGDGAVVAGRGMILNSSALGSIASDAMFEVGAANVSAGKIALLLDPAATLDPTDSLSLLMRGRALTTLQNSSSLTLGSRSSISFYGSGVVGSPALKSLELHAAQLLGYGQGGGEVTLSSTGILIDNAEGAAAARVRGAPNGSLRLDSKNLQLGRGNVTAELFSSVVLGASSGIVAFGTGSFGAGSFDGGRALIPSDLTINTPTLTAGGPAADYQITSSSFLNFFRVPGTSPDAGLIVGKGGGISLLAASGLSLDSTVMLSSGNFTAETLSGDLAVGTLSGALISAAGASMTYGKNLRTADAGTVSLIADAGNVILGSKATIDVSAAGNSSAGSLSVTAISKGNQANGDSGNLILDPGAVIKAHAVSLAEGGAFTLDAGSLSDSSTTAVQMTSKLSWIAPILETAGFTRSQSFRFRNGDVSVDAQMKASSVSISADSGSITVTGSIDASGATGGNIAIQAAKSVLLESGSSLSVHGLNYDTAGKGGTILLSAGSQVNGVISPDALLDLRSGSLLDLGVTQTSRNISGDPLKPESDQFGGILHLRAPLIVSGSGEVTGIRAGDLSSEVMGASLVALEGSMLYDVTALSSGLADPFSAQPLVQGIFRSGNSAAVQMTSDINRFYGSPLQTTLQARFLAQLQSASPTLDPSSFLMVPGVEINNRNGGISLNSDWNLASIRAGSDGVPGFLSLRASGDLILNATLSDGFTGTKFSDPLLARNLALPGNFQSWSYLLSAGSDVASADPSVVTSASLGNVELGVFYTPGGRNIIPIPADTRRNTAFGPNGKTSDALAGYYQVIRTGTGDISVSASGSLDLRNQFASIYTAGTVVLDPTLGGTFDTPKPDFSNQDQVGLGLPQQNAPMVQFTLSGGNISIAAGKNIQHVAKEAGTGLLIADSVLQMPSNWLYRRGAVDPTTLQFLKMPNAGDLASTAWWVDFANFFEGVGALGGGNISMSARGSIANVDAVIPTNYRMPGRDAVGSLVQAGALQGIELGGGNLSLSAGKNLDAGVYYVEQGSGTIRVGGEVKSNSTRDPQSPSLTKQLASISQSYLPTTLFTGNSSFDIIAAGNILLGPVANVFLTPEGNNNGYPYQTYFSTYSPEASVDAVSLGGDVTLRQSTVSPGGTGGLLQLWYRQMTPPRGTTGSFRRFTSFYQPWIWLNVSSVTDLGPQLGLMAPTLDVSAMSGDITIQGNLTLAPSNKGGLDLLAAGQINGLANAGSQNGTGPVWASSSIVVSDADPARVPSVSAPLSRISLLSASDRNTPSSYGGAQVLSFVQPISSLFAESGSFTGISGVLGTKLALHDASLLHASDPNPLSLVAGSGDISGLQLFSPKRAEITASGSITDVALYIQNVAPTDVSVISAGADVKLFDPVTPLQLMAQAAMGLAAKRQAGDIQISGPGTLEVLAGGSIDLGNGPNNADGTGVGVTSIGNARNPSLPFEGANLIMAAGVSLLNGMGGGVDRAKSLIDAALALPDSSSYFKELADQVALGGNDDLSESLKDLEKAYQEKSLEGISSSSILTDDQKSRLALALFYIILRDSGRDHNNPDSPSYGSYTDGRKAISSFLQGEGVGELILRTQNVRTLSGGSISLYAPKGGVSLASVIPPTLNTLTPPGIVTEHGGSVNIFTRKNVDIGIGRIFTLRGGDITIWSDLGNIAAGSSAKTVATAPPTRVLIDPQSGNIQTDLAGLATGGGIGVLDTVVGIPPGFVDLIAPSGVIDAGDAGIRATGKLNLAATKILNADNIQAAVTVAPPSSSAPAAAPPAAAPPAAAPPAAASTAAAANNSAAQTASKNNNSSAEGDQTPSIFSIDILGYGGGDSDDEEKKSADASAAPVQASL